MLSLLRSAATQQQVIVQIDLLPASLSALRSLAPFALATGFERFELPLLREHPLPHSPCVRARAVTVWQ